MTVPCTRKAQPGRSLLGQRDADESAPLTNHRQVQRGYRSSIYRSSTEPKGGNDTVFVYPIGLLTEVRSGILIPWPLPTCASKHEIPYLVLRNRAIRSAVSANMRSKRDRLP